MALPERHLLRTRPRSKSFMSAITHRNRLMFLSFLVVTIALFSFFHQAIASSVSLRSSAVATTSSVFSLLVTVQFDSVEHKKQFLEDFKPVAEYVQSSEPDTLSYELLLSDNDPLQAMILERYKDKENAYMKVHKSSTPFLAFRPKLQAMQENGYVTISGNSYLDSGAGFGDRTES